MVGRAEHGDWRALPASASLDRVPWLVPGSLYDLSDIPCRCGWKTGLTSLEVSVVMYSHPGVQGKLLAK